MTDNESYLTCRIGTEWYGINVHTIVEVVYMVALNDVYNPAPHVLGLMTLRKSLIPVLDMRRRFGITSAPLTLSTPLVAVRTPVGSGAFVVDETDTIIPIDVALLESSPLSGISGAVRLNQKTLFLLDAAQLIQEVSLEQS